MIWHRNILVYTITHADYPCKISLPSNQLTGIMRCLAEQSTCTMHCTILPSWTNNCSNSSVMQTYLRLLPLVFCLPQVVQILHNTRSSYEAYTFLTPSGVQRRLFALYCLQYFDFKSSGAERIEVYLSTSCNSIINLNISLWHFWTDNVKLLCSWSAQKFLPCFEP